MLGLAMACCYRPVDRDQRFLLPPDMADWLPEGHLVWLVLDVVERVDTSGLHEAYRLGGVGRRAYDPDMLLGLLIYAYCTGVRSSRQIERLCSVDVAFRVICANDGPDHSTIARFRQVHERVARQLFVDVLAICARVGVARVGVVAVDGTKVAGSGSMRANRTRAQLEAEVAGLFASAEQTDSEEDDRFGSGRGDDLPVELGRRERRRVRLDAALAEIEAEEQARRAVDAVDEEANRARLDGGRGPVRRELQVARAETILARVRVEETARREQVRARVTARGHKMPPIRGAHPEGFRVARAEAQLARVKARAAAEAGRKTVRQRRREREPIVNVTDPDSRVMPVVGGWVQGYNAQMAVTTSGVVVAAEISQNPSDAPACVPMMAATQACVADSGIEDKVAIMLFDAGYFSIRNLTAPGPDRLIATTKKHKLEHMPATAGAPPETAGPVAAMEHRLRTPEGAALYKKRQSSVEPVFGHTKHNRRFDRFSRRGLRAVNAEWKLIATAHNITKLFAAGYTTLADT